MSTALAAELNVREALGLDLSVLSTLVDKAFGLLETGRMLEGERLLSDLSEVVNLSFTLSYALGAAREARKDWFGAAEAYREALARAERANGPPAFRQQAHLAEARAWIGFGDLARARAAMDRVLAGRDPALIEQAKTWLTAAERVR
jgi:hypothetical protein